MLNTKVSLVKPVGQEVFSIRAGNNLSAAKDGSSVIKCYRYGGGHLANACKFVKAVCC